MITESEPKGSQELFKDIISGRLATHNSLLAAVPDLSDKQLLWLPGPYSPSIGFHLWHTTRWVDLDLSVMRNEDQIWRKKHLARQWRISEATLGETDTGTGMEDSASAKLVLPGKAKLIAYTQEVFDEYKLFVNGLSSVDLTRVCVFSPQKQSTIAGLLVEGMTHDNRHLGMIEALKGALGLDGSATR